MTFLLHNRNNYIVNGFLPDACYKIYRFINYVQVLITVYFCVYMFPWGREIYIYNKNECVYLYIYIYLYLYIYIYISERWCEQESLACYSPRGCKESNTAWWLNNTTNIYIYIFTSLVSQTVKNLLAIQGTWVRSLGQEDPGE